MDTNDIVNHSHSQYLTYSDIGTEVNNLISQGEISMGAIRQMRYCTGTLNLPNPYYYGSEFINGYDCVKLEFLIPTLDDNKKIIIPDFTKYTTGFSPGYRCTASIVRTSSGFRLDGYCTDGNSASKYVTYSLYIIEFY